MQTQQHIMREWGAMISVNAPMGTKLLLKLKHHLLQRTLKTQQQKRNPLNENVNKGLNKRVTREGVQGATEMLTITRHWRIADTVPCLAFKKI